MNETTTTNTTVPQPTPLKRCAIIGTAQSWNQCPWADQGLEVWGLNDAYLIGIPRANRWYDIHPPHQWVLREQGARGSSGPVRSDQYPEGGYVRPAAHSQWLRQQQFPVFLWKQRPDIPNSHAFPFEKLLDAFAPVWPYRLDRKGQIVNGTDYETSSPAWMLMHAIAEGYKEIHVYGIHLATQWEYVTQRPNFEWLLGFAAGQGVKIVLPASTPICRAPFRYGVETKADVPVLQLQREIERIKHHGANLQRELASLKWYERERRKDLLARLAQLDLDVTDARGALTRAQAVLAA